MLKFNYDEEGYCGNTLFWASLTEADEKYVSLFFNGMDLMDTDDIPKRAYLEKLVIYHDINFNACLELNCGNGDRIEQARKKLLRNTFGCDDEDYLDYWEEIGITPYCQIVDTSHLPYDSNSFDFIIACLEKYGDDKDKISRVLDEIIRVGCRMIYISGKEFDDKWWIQQILRRGIIPEVVSRMYPDMICLEGTLMWNSRISLNQTQNIPY